jgi:hypothetical protein
MRGSLFFMPIDPASASPLLTGVLGKLNLDGFIPFEYRKRLARERAQLKVLEATVEAAGEAQVEAARKGEMVFNTQGEPMPLAWRLQKEMTRVAEQHGAEAVAAAFCASMEDAVRKRENVAAAIDAADAELKQGSEPETPPPPPVDDWLFRWRDYAGEVSAEEMQTMWGRVLAGEVRTPGAFSMRTLQFMRNMSKKEAELVARIGPFACLNYVLRDTEYLASQGITFSDLLGLDELGILNGVEGLLNRNLKGAGLNRPVPVWFDSKSAVMAFGEAGKELTFGVYQVTQLGLELLRLDTYVAPSSYPEKIAEVIRAMGFQVRHVKIGEKIVLPGTVP